VVVVFVAAGSASTTPECPANTTTFSIESQGQNTTTRIDVVVRNLRSACMLATSAVVTVERDGARVRIVGNPRREIIRQLVRAGSTAIVRLDWANWCHARTGFRVNVTVSGRRASAPVNHVPVCLQRHETSKLLTVP
jgi:hypothetical protein